MARYFVDCREMPSEINCSLYMSGEKDHVIRASIEHAISMHSHEDTPELREMVESQLKEEQAPVGIGA
jgi:hypothetical protein